MCNHPQNHVTANPAANSPAASILSFVPTPKSHSSLSPSPPILILRSAMDPNPKSFPLLSYVLSRLNLASQPPSPLEPDIEQPLADPPPQAALGIELSRMPADLLASMTRAIADVAETRAVLQTLGDRPDHESVDAARARLNLIDADLAHKLEEIVLSPRPDGVDRIQWRATLSEREKECRDEAEREKNESRSIIQMYEMHEGYERMLREAEVRLERMYGSAAEGGGGDESEPPAVAEGEEEQINEEVIGILQEASGRYMERVELADRQLKFLPEAFGRMRGLVYLNLSNNLLEAIPDSIAGLDHLVELNVSGNQLVALPDSIGLLVNLKILNVSANQLNALPDSIANCRSLVELNASYNGLTYLPTKLGYELVNLEKLCVQLNKIRTLPTSVCEMRSLRLLDVHFNELRGLPYAIGKLTNLETLNLSSNFSDLTELPDSIGELTNLRELDLSNNQIHVLPITFGRLDQLMKLNLDQNPLVEPPMEIVNNGVEAVKEYMAKRWLDILLEEERKSQLTEESTTPQAGWLTRSTSWLSSVVSGVSESVAGYMAVGGKPDPYLDQQL